jgi:hypothetical protein
MHQIAAPLGWVGSATMVVTKRWSRVGTEAKGRAVENEERDEDGRGDRDTGNKAFHGRTSSSVFQ